MSAEPVITGYSAGRLDELQRENEALRDQVRRLTVHTQVTRGAIMEAAQEREVAERMAHHVVVEEQATRAAVAVQGNTLGFGVVLGIMNFFLTLLIAFGLFVWLPNEIATRFRPATTTTVIPGGGTVIR